MANIIFNRALTEGGFLVLTEEATNVLLENQDDILIVVDYTNMAYVEASPRKIYIQRGNR